MYITNSIKYFVLFSISLSNVICQATPLRLEKKLILPDYRRGSSAKKIQELQSLLNKGELQQYYVLWEECGIRGELFRKLNDESDPIKKVQIANALLAICGMVLSAPIFERELIPQVSKWASAMTPKIDLSAKRIAMMNLNTLVVNMLSIDSKESKLVQETAIHYFAYALNFHKHIYNPAFTREWADKKNAEFEKTVQEAKMKQHNEMPTDEREKIKIQNESKVQFPTPITEVAIYATNTYHVTSMNTMVRTTINFGEECLIELIVKVYQARRSKAWELIMEAGYTKEEIPALLNRTVGRNPKTEFLFPDAKKK